jgi:hypothetical protein
VRDDLVAGLEGADAADGEDCQAGERCEGTSEHGDAADHSTRVEFREAFG